MKRFTLLLSLVLISGLLISGCDKPKVTEPPTEDTSPNTIPKVDPDSAKTPPLIPTKADTAVAEAKKIADSLQDLLSERGTITDKIKAADILLGGIGKVDMIDGAISKLQKEIPLLNNEYVNSLKQSAVFKEATAKLMPDLQSKLGNYESLAKAAMLLQGNSTDQFAALPAIKSLLDGNADLGSMLKSLSDFQSKLDTAKNSDSLAERLGAALIEKQVTAEQAKVDAKKAAIVEDASKAMIAEKNAEADAAKAEADVTKAQVAKLETDQAKAAADAEAAKADADAAKAKLEELETARVEAAAAQAELDKELAKQAAIDKEIAEMKAKLAELEAAPK